ncbi:Panacea domain-containing protein [Polaromonas sp.]|uniref:Panacea domain-containing protein n=1 Tax=Polaromonas sp. TaxID=1869339 RepID=UPI00356914DB
MYDEEKAAQAAAFLLSRAKGKLYLLSLVKLMYLSERLSFERYGVPLTGDSLVSMDYGPVLSTTLNHMNGAIRSKENGWDSWVSDRADHMVALRDGVVGDTPENDLMALSDSDLEVLGEVWARFGHMSRWDLVKYTHTLPEWKDPRGSSMSIEFDDLFKAIGFSSDVSDDLRRRIVAERNINLAFA